MNRLWKEWLTLHRIVKAAAPDYLKNAQISAPFMSSDSGLHNAQHRLLFIGQATGRGWYDKEFMYEHNLDTPYASIISERQARNRTFVSDNGRRNGLFWHTFREMSRKLGNADGEHSNALWSNIAKIGVSSGNPKGMLLSLQSDLAARTLQSEISAYHPSVVVFASGEYGSSIVLSATKTIVGNWKRSEDDPVLKRIDNDFWWIPRDGQAGTPAYLWTRHPSHGVSSLRRNLWVNVAFQLSSGSMSIHPVGSDKASSYL
jgi:hypothetical protein